MRLATGVRRVLGFLGALVLAAPVALGDPSTDPSTTATEPLALCERQLAERPEDYASYLCFYLEYRGVGARVSALARERLETLRRTRPELGWPALVAGYFADAAREDAVALERYEEAARGLEARGEVEGLVLARGNLRRALLRRGDAEAAAEQVELARRVTETSHDPVARARFLTLEASHRLDTHGDLGLAYRALHRAQTMVFPDGPYGLQRSILFRLASLAFHLGRYDEAIDAHARIEALLLEHGTAQDLAGNAFNWANARMAMLEIEPRPGGLAELEERARHALVLAERHQRPDISASSHAMLARLLAARSPTQAREHLEACHQLAARHRLAEVAAGCWWRAALARLGGDPEADWQAARRAVEAAEATANDLLRAHAWRSRLRAAWYALPPTEAEAEAERALAAIETLREHQLDAGRRAQMIGNWTAEYTWLAGRQLADRDDVAGAFATLERLRARVLLESLERSDARPLAEDARRGLAEARRGIAAVQRRLIDPALDRAERRRLLDRLEALELEERSFRPSVEVGAIRFARLAEVVETLAADEALLVFQVDLETDLFGQSAGGSWVLVITHDDQRAVALGDRARLLPAIPMLRGLVERRDGRESEVARRLYERLLGRALEGIDPAIERLILVPDDRLHQLPFALLEGPEGPLGLRYELVVAPSATLWHRWRHEPVEPAEHPALVFADPSFGVDADTAHDGTARDDSVARTRNAVLVSGLELGRLPQARLEGRAIRRHLGARLLTGGEASEHALADIVPRRYGIVHFASHALADLERPERSCLLLAPGGDEHDGLLRAPEIAALDFAGRAVVLSACQTSHGAVLRGEGIFSLSRAFFEAGAHAVLGSRWPLRDREAALFFEPFYRRLAAGDPLATALRAARRQAHASGLPAEAWAGPVLVGRGDLGVPTHSPTWRRAPWLVAAGLAMLVIVVLVRRRHRR